MRVRQVTGVLLIMALAGCGTATALTGKAHGGSRPGGPPPGSRAESLRLARQLLARNPLPPGARRLPQRPVPPGLRQVLTQYGVKSAVDIYQLYALPASMRQSAAFMRTHAPAGMKSGGTGQSSGRSGVTEMDVSYFPSKLPRGISSAGLTDMIVPAPHGGSSLRVDAQVIWYPPRSAAEYLVAKDYRAIQIDASLYGSKARNVRKTFTSRALITKLTRLLDGLPASPGGVFPCPIMLASYRLTFEAVAGHPNAVVSTSGCFADSISVGGVSQPALLDNHQLIALAGKIMHVNPKLPGPGARPAS